MGYAIGFAVIKYQEGFIDLPGYGSRSYRYLSTLPSLITPS